jgi:nitrite reductase (cytochrome c-552)
MPYQREGALKISDHHVRSPLLMVNRACQTCHRWSEEELRARVHTIQDRTYELRNRGLDAVVALIADLEAAKAAGKSDAELEPARKLQRRAQFMVDFIEAENSMGFHASQESARILGVAADLARQGQVAIRDPSFKPQIQPSAIAPDEREVSPGMAPAAR